MQVVTPTKLDHKERELIEQFAAAAQGPGAPARALPAGALRASCATASSTSDRGVSFYLRRRPRRGRRVGDVRRARRRRGAARRDGEPGAGRARRCASATGAGSSCAARSTASIRRALVLPRRDGRAARAIPSPRVARPGPRQGRPRRARRAGGDRARRRRVVPWAAERIISRWEGAEGRQGPRALARDRARGGEAVDPVAGARGRAVDDDEAARARAPRRRRARARSDRRGAAVAARPGDRRRDAATDVVARGRSRGRHRPAELDASRAAGAIRVRLGDRSCAPPRPAPPRSRVAEAPALGRW